MYSTKSRKSKKRNKPFLVREGLQNGQCYSKILDSSGKYSRCPNQTLLATEMWCSVHAPNCKKKQALYKIACEDILEAICEDILDKDLSNMSLDELYELVKIVEINYNKNSTCYNKVKDFEDECIFDPEYKHVEFYENVNKEANKCQTLLQSKLNRSIESKRLKVRKEFEERSKIASELEEIERKRMKEEREELEQEEQRRKKQVKEIEKEIRMLSKKPKSTHVSKDELPLPEIRINPEQELDNEYEETMGKLDKFKNNMELEIDFLQDLGRKIFDPVFKTLKSIGIKEFENKLDYELKNWISYIDIKSSLSENVCAHVTSNFYNYLKDYPIVDQNIKPYNDLRVYLKNINKYSNCVFRHSPPSSFKTLPLGKKKEILKTFEESINYLYANSDGIKYVMIEDQLVEFLQKYFNILYSIHFIFFKPNHSSSYVIQLLKHNPFTIDKVKDNILKGMGSYTENNNFDQKLFDRIFSVPVFQIPVENGKIKKDYVMDQPPLEIYQNILQIKPKDPVNQKLYKYFYTLDVYISLLDYILNRIKDFYLSVKRLEIIYSKITSTQIYNFCPKYNLILLDFINNELDDDKRKNLIKLAYQCEIDINKQYILNRKKDKEIIDSRSLEDLFDKNINMELSKQGKISRQAFDLLFEPTLFLASFESTPNYSLPYRG
jgi:hypothetical protein